MFQLRKKANSYITDVKGTVVIGFLIIMLPIYLSVAALWNTSVLAERKIKAQTIADAAAYSIAGEVAALTNQMTMLNMLQLRIKCAQAIETACIGATLVGAVEIYENYEVAEALMAVPETAEAGLALMLEVIADSIRLGLFVSSYILTDIISITIDGAKCQIQQKKLYKNFGALVRERLDTITEYINQDSGTGEWKIYATMNKSSLYPTECSTPPFLAKSTFLNRGELLAFRLITQDEQWIKVKHPLFVLIGKTKPKKCNYIPPPSLPFSTPFFKGFKTPETGDMMKYAWFASLATAGAIYNIIDWGYDLSSRNLIKEWDINSKNDRRIFQTLVFVERTESNHSFMAKGFFKPFAGATILAASGSEAVNEYDELLQNYQIARVPVIKEIINLIMLLPWRLWTSMGANYQPRLNAIDPQLFDAVLNNSGNAQMKEALLKNTGLKADNLSAKNVENSFVH